MFKPGQSGNPKGRPKGSNNKFTDLKEEFLQAFYDKDGIGGAKGIKELMKNSTRNKMVFLQMIAKMLPTNVSADLSGDVNITLNRVITDERPPE